MSMPHILLSDRWPWRSAYSDKLQVNKYIADRICKECFKSFDVVDKECSNPLMFLNHGMYKNTLKPLKNEHHSHNTNIPDFLCILLLLRLIPHFAKFSLNIEVLPLLPGPVKPDAVWMRRKSLMFLHFRQLLPSVPLTSEPLTGLLHGIQSSVITATNLVDLSK